MATNMHVTIRRAAPNEATATALTKIAISAKQSNGYDDAFMDACRDELTISIRDLCNGEYWVAETDVILGFVCLTELSVQKAGEIHSFFVDTAWQRKGIGDLLWQKIGIVLINPASI